jgi:hypothetical protein
VPALASARSPFSLFDEVERAREVLILTYTASLEFFERFGLADARAMGALVTVISDAKMVYPDPTVVRRAGTQYLDARAVCPGGAFHPKLLVIVGDGQARVAIGSGNLTLTGWHGNAETWTVLRADEDGGPDSLRDVSAFLRGLEASPIALSPGAREALQRTAEGLDELPTEAHGPRVLSSLTASIIKQLPEPDGPVLELVMYAPFHDARLAALHALLDHYRPAQWTIFVRPDTEVDGPALDALVRQRGGRIAWVARETQVDGKVVADERYWHGKLVQWRTEAGVWALTGSPNLSSPALMNAVPDGGNCELAVLSSIDEDLTPDEGAAPAGGPAVLERQQPDRDARPAALLLAAVAHDGLVTLQLYTQLRADGVVQRYDVSEDQWRTTATLTAGYRDYEVDLAQAPIGHAVRILLDGGGASNSVFVTDLARVLRAQTKAIGKVRASPQDVAAGGLGYQLLADLDELRPHLLRVGAIVPVHPDGASDGHVEDADAAPARPSEGVTLEEYLAACDPVLGQRMTEFALVLPALPGIGATLDDTAGTLDTDEDTDATDEEATDDGGTLTDELNKRHPSERERYRRFVERLVDRSPHYPPVVRALALRTLLHSIAAHLWDQDTWPELLTTAICALTAPGDVPRDDELAAAASLAAVALAMLRTDVRTISHHDEHTMRYEHAGRTVATLLGHADPERIELLASGLRGRLAGASGVLAAERAIVETLHPPHGPDRAIQILAEEHDHYATLDEDGTIVLHKPLNSYPDPMLILVLALTEDDGPVFVRGTTTDGKRALAGWCAPLLAVERVGEAGAFGRAWRFAPAQPLITIDRADLPRGDMAWAARQPRPADVEDLLGLIEPTPARQGTLT